ncbi:MAG: YraN family protein [Sphingobacteriaceae bacterium]
MASHLDLGQKGEQLAKVFLEKMGHEILEENWTYRKAEVDLITYITRTIIFVEVKTRSGSAYGEPEAFVDTRKQRLLSDAADQYILLMNHEGEVRFDIISILFDKHGAHTLKHIEDAFWPGMDQE